MIVLPGLLVFGAVSAVLPIVGIPLLVLWLVGTAIVLSTLGGIFRTALYLYASTGQAPAAFPQQQLSGAFRPKTAKL